jgi:hypothetical protein
MTPEEPKKKKVEKFNKKDEFNKISNLIEDIKNSSVRIKKEI